MKIYHQSTFNPWPFEDGSIQAIITSPPYLGLRKYDIPDVVIGGSADCEHEWGIPLKRKTSNNYNAGFNERWGNSPGQKKQEQSAYGEILQGSICALCGAWQGQYGLEADYRLYVEHTLLWASEARRVLRPDGMLFLNLGDSYGGSWGNYGARNGNQRAVNMERFDDGGRKSLPQDFRPGSANTLPKCKLLIPHRVAIALIDAGWTLRNDIIWFKRNAMPESVTDRFSKKYENIFMFSKSEKYYFDLDAVREKYAETTLERVKHGYGEGGKSEQYRELGHYQKSAHEMNRQHAKKILSGEAKGKNPGDLWDIPTQPSPEKHYAMWPEALVGRMVKCTTRPGDAVLDPFCGSGTTLRVADKLNRVAYGIDLGYADIQGRRLSAVQKELL